VRQRSLGQGLADTLDRGGDRTGAEADGPGWLAVAALAAGTTGGLVHGLWAPLGLGVAGTQLDAPFPGLWRWFFALGLPGLFLAFSAVHAWLLAESAPGPAADAARAAWRRDRMSYALLPGFLLLMAAADGLGGWRWPLATFYVGVLIAKTLGLVAALYGGAVAAESSGDVAHRRGVRPRFLFVAALLLYGFLAPYVVIAISTGGDEPLYLLNTVSLATDGDVHIRNNVEQEAYRSFYWGRPAPEAWRLEFAGIPLLLLPGYVLGTSLLPGYPLGGRLGATLTVALCGALAGVQVYRLSRELGASPPAAFWAWLLVALTPPVLVHSGHVYPELPAALLTMVGVRTLLRIPARGWTAIVVVAGTALGLVLLKDRYTPLALGLCLWALARLARSHRWVALGLLGGLAAAGATVVLLNPVPLVFPNVGTPTELAQVWRTWNPEIARAAVGMLADQEYGLWFYTPHGLLAVLGLVLLWQRRPDVAAGLLGLFAFYLVVLVKYRWMRWHGGFTPPPRFLLIGAVLLGPGLAVAFDRCRGPALAAVNTLWLAWSAALGLAVSLVPAWRYHHLRGRNVLLERLSAGLGIDAARLLPSLSAPSAWTWAVLVLAALGFAGIALAAGRWKPTPRAGWGRDAVWLAPRPAARLVVTLGLVWLGLAAIVPTWGVEAEAMRHSSGLQYVSFDDRTSFWHMTSDGELSEPLVTWPGLTEIRVLAAALTTTGEAPRMALVLDDEVVATWGLRAGPGVWLSDTYVARMPTRFGHPRLTLRLTGLQDDPAAGRVQHVYLDRVELRRVALEEAR
jgi:hypothetical protein